MLHIANAGTDDSRKHLHLLKASSRKRKPSKRDTLLGEMTQNEKLFARTIHWRKSRRHLKREAQHGHEVKMLLDDDAKREYHI
jgi:hypothetical protein